MHGALLQFPDSLREEVEGRPNGGSQSCDRLKDVFPAISPEHQRGINQITIG